MLSTLHTADPAMGILRMVTADLEDNFQIHQLCILKRAREFSDGMIYITL